MESRLRLRLVAKGCDLQQLQALEASPIWGEASTAISNDLNSLIGGLPGTVIGISVSASPGGGNDSVQLEVGIACGGASELEQRLVAVLYTPHDSIRVLNNFTSYLRINGLNVPEIVLDSSRSLVRYEPIASSVAPVPVPSMMPLPVPVPVSIPLPSSLPAPSLPGYAAAPLPVSLPTALALHSTHPHPVSQEQLQPQRCLNCANNDAELSELRSLVHTQSESSASLYNEKIALERLVAELRRENAELKAAAVPSMSMSAPVVNVADSVVASSPVIIDDIQRSLVLHLSDRPPRLVRANVPLSNDMDEVLSKVAEIRDLRSHNLANCTSPPPPTSITTRAALTTPVRLPIEATAAHKLRNRSSFGPRTPQGSRLDRRKPWRSGV